MKKEHTSIKKVVDELIKKRIRKKVASSEFYKKELPEHIANSVESAKETVMVSFILFIILKELNFPQKELINIFLFFYTGWFFWKICQIAMIGWTRLNRLHRVIVEEKFEIEHHRRHERTELEILYKAKGFSGKLLDDVIDVLMADDNRLLQVMMEEEMGLTLRTFEHPLKQGVYAGFSAFLSGSILLLGLATPFFYNFFIFGALIIIFASFISTRFERNILSFSIIWNLAIAALVSLITFYTIRLIVSL